MAGRNAKRVVVPTIDTRINGHRLYAEKWATGWVILCDSWGDLAENYDGCHDLSACLGMFEARATAAGADGTLKESA